MPVSGIDIYNRVVLAISLEAAKNIGIAVVVVFLVGSLAAAWLMKTVVQKLATVFVLLLFAFGVYTQRTAMQDCADAVKSNFERQGTSVTVGDTDCSFFGFTVTVKDPRSGDESE